jgi:NitT/TauT family transport system ATP-binding protein
MNQYGLGGFERKYPHALSGGMQKRAALAQTLAVEPTVLLLDEPFAALDAQTRVVIENDVVKICRAGKRSMILVTHDIAEAISMADRVVVLSRRPATVKQVFEIELSRKAASVADVQSMPEFSHFFKQIWDALDISVTGMSADMSSAA